MTLRSKALEVNLATSYVDVSIEERYLILQAVMAKYQGLTGRLETFLKELSHPYKNWQFIVSEARTFSLDYVHQFVRHEQGSAAADLYIKIFAGALKATKSSQVKMDAADNLLLFLSKLIKTGSPEKFIPVVNNAFGEITKLDGEDFFVFVQSYYQLKAVAARFLDVCEKRADKKTVEEAEEKASSDGLSSGFNALNAMLLKYYDTVYRYWLNEKDCLSWFNKEIGGGSQVGEGVVESINNMLSPLSHREIRILATKTKQIRDRDDMRAADMARKLLELPDYSFFMAGYRKLPETLFNAGKDTGTKNQWKLLSLFLILSTPGLSTLHEEALRDINSTLTWLISREDIKKSQELLKQTFKVLKEQVNRFPSTALNCVLNVGQSVYKTDNTDLINHFIDLVIDLGFHAPMVTGVDNDWKIKANHAHLQNIRTWLALVKLNPQKSSRLLSALSIHLTVSGVFIRDTDLFPRDITGLLNSEISPVYYLVKQLTRLFPVFFNDIGAEGVLRDISTEIDEICQRKDVLVHFLRKQGHVEGSNRLVAFMENAFSFWLNKDKTIVQPYVPPEMYARINESGEYVDDLHAIFTHFVKSGWSLPEDLLNTSDERVELLCQAVPGVSDANRRRAFLAVAYYKLLKQKYTLGFIEIESYIDQLHAEDFPDLKQLKAALAENIPQKKAGLLLDYLEQLKDLILSDKEFEIQQNIYEKRHITVDIPSMYGSYRETKFDALGLTFRLEALINTLFEEIVDTLDLSLITKTTIFQIYDSLQLFVQALSLDGFSTKEIEQQLDLLSQALKTPAFSFPQYLDVFKSFAKAVQNIIKDHFHNLHEQNISKILPWLPKSAILPKFLPEAGKAKIRIDQEKLVHRVSEIFFREKIALSLGLAQLDLFLSRILNVLFNQANTLPEERLYRLLNYDPARTIADINENEIKKYGILHLGNKGLNLINLKACGCPVPPGFIITTEVFRCREIIDNYQPAEEIFRHQLADHLRALEKTAGKVFGDPDNPLLLSVRSGASISQPGMMDTILNVGINEDVVRGIAKKTGNTWFAWDNYRRFLQCYGMAHGMNRDVFDAQMRSHKKRCGVQLKKEFSGQQMEQLALNYKQCIEDKKITVIDDPMEQLYVAIKNVIDSWFSAKAESYRKIVGISDDWGTAVTIQAMIYGNLSRQSGSGVFFTHSPRLSGDTMRLWGDFTVGNQGEDVVAGLVTTLPISVKQKEIEQRKTDITLETHFPKIYNALKKWVNQMIYDYGWSPQEIEFTFEGPEEEDLYLLQTRDMTIRENKNISIFDPEDVLDSEKFLGQGIGVSGGALSGRIVFSLEEIDKWALAEPDTFLIMVRRDTVPDDIREISATDGLLTARGGLSSHAAVLAHRLGKTCVVGCGSLVCKEEESICRFNNIVLRSGDYISIDGSTGSVYQGFLRIKKIETPV